MNLENIKHNLSTTQITFLVDINKSIDIDKSEKFSYFRINAINLAQITSFIINIRKDDIILIQPLISVNLRITDPYLTLSRFFLVTNMSNPGIVYNFLYDQIKSAEDDFNIDLEEVPYFSIFKWKRVYFSDKFC